jgi:LacI family transcriptional regulator
MCKVSTQTVSRVLNNRADVAPDTRAAVEKAIADLGYHPSALARSLVQQRSYTLGAITAGLRYTGVSQTLNGITEQCEASNYALLLKELPRFDVADITPILHALIARHVEGIIFAAPEIGGNVEKIQAQLPAVCPPILFLKSQPSARHRTIGIDNYSGALQAVEYLRACGRRHIGLITGPLDWLEARQRRQAWVDSLTRAGTPVSDHQWAMGNWSSASGEAGIAELVQRYPQIDAVFASNDQMALGVLHYAAMHGIRIPDDLAVVGFDDLPEAAYFTPALTTVRQPLRELGMLAVKSLLAQIEEDSATPAELLQTLPTELIIRDSTPRAPAALSHPT